MLPENTQYIFSTIVPRKPNKHTSFIKVMGHQYAIAEYLSQPITQEMIDEAEIELFEQGYQLNKIKWQYILDNYNGYLPLEIRALPEGIIVPIGVATVTIINTDPNCAWLVSYIETMFQRVCWKMTTVASIALNIYHFLNEYMVKHTGSYDLVQYHLHNFGSRGADSFESDIMSGIAHLSSGFRGTDCLQANRYIKYYYNTKLAYGSSITASEHSIMCAWSNPNDRDDYLAAVKLIDILEYKIQHKIGLPIVSIVGDTYDIYRFTQEYIGTRLKERIIQLGALGGRVVVRPDSGDPQEVCIEVIKLLMDCFGYSVNEYGYKVLPSYIGVIQGDGINAESIRMIVDKLDNEKLSLQNLVFGMGGGLTHEAGRDEFSFSMKATAIFNGEKWLDLFKDPITDISKKSLRGVVTTVKKGNSIFSERTSIVEKNNQLVDLMETVFYNGKIVKQYTFEEVIYSNVQKGIKL